MPLPLHELAHTDPTNSIVRLTENGLEFFPVARRKSKSRPRSFRNVLSNLENNTAFTST